MAEHYLDFGTDVRREALEFAASESGRPAYLLEKDIWVVWTLRTLFAAPVGDSLVSKGGTSLSKAYGVIRRFSEDVDLTYGVRDIAPDLIGDSSGVDEPLDISLQHSCVDVETGGSRIDGRLGISQLATSRHGAARPPLGARTTLWTRNRPLQWQCRTVPERCSNRAVARTCWRPSHPAI